MMAATRPVVSYDDITLPYDQPDELQPSSSHNAHHPPPPKKRKKNNQKAKQHKNASNSTSQRAEFLNSTGGSSKQPPEGEKWDADDYGNEDEDGGEGEESRELTHEEIWDDSALVNAWEAATEEYEAYHGPDKGWKGEPVKKSPLWYNVPVASSTKDVKAGASSSTNVPSATALEPDSQPLNFDTFVPTHDPSLDIPTGLASDQLPVPDTMYIPAAGESAVVSQDEAFSRALNAMYWGGYWTAIYHAQRQLATQSTALNAPSGAVGGAVAAEEEEEDEDLEQIEIDVDDFTSTQR
ncbi:hypothetical protein M413DRAFT_236086 [Hebeloma cylindrosporum]|uniref:Survival Motor Neuron Gemin2-binding domain-containing protein n=1 Tax=Hebeloma cylindrosporum TaxID=76867 RepID=A0A0C3C4F1_HEBCY|nr:hypothetical protein M413DRAFT_236086 [Hebeloma cylindrosporum h7]